MQDAIARFVKDESGLTAVEYAIIAGSLALLLLVSLGGIGGKVKGWFQSSSNGMS